MGKTILQQILSVFKRTTYTITPKSFSEQFEGVNLESFKEVKVTNPMSQFVPLKYKANQLKKIIVVDENTHRVVLDNSPALETKITLKNGKKHHFYFDTLVFEDDSIMGGKSRFIPSLSGKIPFESIQKIEVQNGGKRYKYQ